MVKIVLHVSYLICILKVRFTTEATFMTLITEYDGLFIFDTYCIVFLYLLFFFLCFQSKHYPVKIEENPEKFEEVK